MRTYVIDELTEEHLDKLQTWLKKQKMQSGIEGIYKIQIPETMLDEEQKQHLADCGPYYLALELDKDAVKMEMLVRAQKIMRCSCIRYASPRQREVMLDKLDHILKELDIAV